jgi:hypothetical protein
MRSERSDGLEPIPPKEGQVMETTIPQPAGAVSAPAVPRTLHAICADVRGAHCPYCDTHEGGPCVTGPEGYHLGRVALALGLTLITADDFADVLRVTGITAAGVVVVRDETPDGAL